MSIPKRDPDFTMTELAKVGEKFLAAGLEYWEAAHKAGIGGAVMWLTSENDAMVIYTRGEYREQILQTVGRMGPTINFGAMTAVDRLARIEAEIATREDNQ